MNILMFTRCMGSGGTEKVILQLCEALKKSGNRVIVCAANGVGADKLKQLGIPYVEIPDMQKKSLSVMRSILKSVTHLIQAEEIDIVHTHHRMAAFYLYLIKKFKCRQIKTLNTIHNTFTDKKALTKTAFNHTLNVAVGKNVKDNMMHDYGIRQDRLQVIYNAIDNSCVRNEKIQMIETLSEQYFIVGNIGRINTQKGFEFYVEAAQSIKAQHLPIKLLIIGDGVLRNEIENLAAKKGVNDIVLFMGFQSNILNVIRNLDLVVLSSLWEGFPLTPIETFSMGKTIVATDVPGTVEIVKDGYNGIIVPMKNGKAIAEAITKLYENDELRKQLEANAYTTYKEKFSYEAFCENYSAVYRNLLN